MPILVRFMLKHALFGYGVAFVFVATVLVLDLGGLATLMLGSDLGLLAMALLFFFTGLTFASLQMGIAIMTLRPERKEGDGSDVTARPLPALLLPSRIPVRNRRH